MNQGQKWKESRKRFNRAFAPQHLVTLLPVILDACRPFIKHLEHFAKTGEEFALQKLCTNLTFDIIGECIAFSVSSPGPVVWPVA